MILRYTTRGVPTKKVDAIKAHRRITGSGLKESKAIFDKAERHTAVTSDAGKISHHDLNTFVVECFDAGYIVETIGTNPVYGEYCQELRQMIAQQILSGHDDIARDLMGIVHAYMPMEVLPVDESQIVVDNTE